MKKPRDLDAVQDMEQAAKLALKFLDGYTEDDFYDDEKTQAAVIRKLEVIGEAATRVSQSFKDKHSSIPWQDIIGMRHKLIHHYDDVEMGIVWGTCQNSLKELLEIINTQIKQP